MTAAADVFEQLRASPLRIVGRFTDASNLTLLALTGDDLRCVYKPAAGERPLWDFPTGTLADREVAMFVLAQALSWSIVPETVLRTDGPQGPGVCQRFVEQAPAAPVQLVAGNTSAPGWRMVAQGEDESGAPLSLIHQDSPDVRRIALLDLIANNADRKGGHLMRDPAGRLWGIDHGLTFHHEDKLRTVLWGFAGEPIEPSDLDDLRRLVQLWQAVAASLAPHLTDEEIAASGDRLAALVSSGVFPEPTPGWPRLPWPPM